jgi:CubicO group peptidase (beta-lactamase class C family)
VNIRFHAGMALLIALALAASPEAPLTRCLAALARNLDFSGVVSILRPDGPTLFAQGVPDDARFNLGSAGKMFTAVAVAQLVDAGKVRLDVPIGAYVKGLTPEAAAVTVRQLLTHSSGLGNFFAPENLTAIEKARTASDLLPLVAADKPSFPPGSRFQYSNSGFVLLGILVERVSGQGYGEYLEHHVFKPAGMVASGLDPGPASTRAVGTTAMSDRPQGPGGPPARGPLRPAREAALHGNPAGGGYSTASDMQKFFAALLGAQLTSAAMLKKLSSSQIVAVPANGASPELGYGLGFGVGTFQGHRWFGHNGGAPGVNVETAAYPDDGAIAIVMSNRDPPAASMLFRKLRAALFDPGFMNSCASE